MSKDEGNVVILLAEDEPVVRNFVQMALAHAGYRVLSAADGLEALKLSRNYEGHIDLILSDVKMPNMMGPELIRTIAAERPGIRVILMTGKSSGEIPEVLRPELLRKPFVPRQLFERIRQTLASVEEGRQR